MVTTGVISLTDCPNRDSPWPWPLSEQWDTCIMPCLFHIPQLRSVIWSCVPINNRESKSWCFFCAINPHGRNSLIFEASSRHWNVVETCNCCLFISYGEIKWRQYFSAMLMMATAKTAGAAHKADVHEHSTLPWWVSRQVHSYLLESWLAHLNLPYLGK